MELYESLFIIRPSVSDEETNALIEKMKDVADKTGASSSKPKTGAERSSPTKSSGNGRAPTPTSISRRRPVGELERSYRLEDNIIKFLTVRLESELVPRRPAEARQGVDGGGI